MVEGMITSWEMSAAPNIQGLRYAKVPTVTLGTPSNEHTKKTRVFETLFTTFCKIYPQLTVSRI
jgi:hypothetical protein